MRSRWTTTPGQRYIHCNSCDVLMPQGKLLICIPAAKYFIHFMPVTILTIPEAKESFRIQFCYATVLTRLIK